VKAPARVVSRSVVGAAWLPQRWRRRAKPPSVLPSFAVVKTRPACRERAVPGGGPESSVARLPAL